jgi:hypothetical protein
VLRWRAAPDLLQRGALGNETSAAGLACYPTSRHFPDTPHTSAGPRRHRQAVLSSARRALSLCCAAGSHSNSGGLLRPNPASRPFS